VNHRLAQLCFITALAVSVLQSCGKGSISTSSTPSNSSTAGNPTGAKDDKSEGAQQVSLAGQAREILERSCASCHGQKSSGGLTNISNLEILVASGLIVPGSPEESLLYRRMLSNMPPPPATLVPKNQSDIIAEWIRSGAPTGSEAQNKNRKPLELEKDIVNLIRNDFNALGTAEQAQARYFTSWPIWNLNISEEVIKDLDQGLSKFVNSLSSSSKLVTPKPLNAERSVFRVFLSDLGWTRAAWAVATTGESYFRHSNKIQELRTLINDPVPVARIDEFIALNAIAPRYYDLQALKPSLDGFLQEDLGRKPLASIYQDVVSGAASMKRYGFNDSQVADFSRVIERHSAPNSAKVFWMSHEFGTQNAEQDPFRGPLGPRSLSNAAGLSDPGFRPDGHEIIFEKPNGMLGFYVALENGSRINEAPSGVRDSTSASATIAVGASCMSCHYDGVIEKQDDIAKVFNTAPLAQAAKQLFGRIFAADTENIFNSDRSRYQKALSDIGVDFRRRDPVHRAQSAFLRNATREEVVVLLQTTDEAFNKFMETLPAEVRQAWTALLNPGGQIARSNVSQNLAAALGSKNIDPAGTPSDPKDPRSVNDIEEALSKLRNR
jgi:mono/diheme cytochrome c family protein